MTEVIKLLKFNQRPSYSLPIQKLEDEFLSLVSRLSEKDRKIYYSTQIERLRAKLGYKYLTKGDCIYLSLQIEFGAQNAMEDKLSGAEIKKVALKHYKITGTQVADTIRYLMEKNRITRVAENLYNFAKYEKYFQANKNKLLTSPGKTSSL